MLLNTLGGATNRAGVGAKKRSSVGLEQFGITLPEGLYREMVEIIERERRWDGRVEFTREAIREKIERHRDAGRSLHPAAARVVSSAKVT